MKVVQRSAALVFRRADPVKVLRMPDRIDLRVLQRLFEYLSGLVELTAVVEPEPVRKPILGDELIGILQGVTTVSLSTANFEGTNYTVVV